MAETPVRLALGTVQFGLPYGLSHSGAAVPREEVEKILALAWERGIDTLDTAADYGDAERMIGLASPAKASFRIVSKAPRIGKEQIAQTDVETVLASIDRSLERLKVQSLDAILVHHAPDLLAKHGDRIFTALQSTRDRGLTKRIGVSVYDPETLATLLERFPIEMVQLPMNLLDQRFEKSGMLAKLSKLGIEVHVRSVFLQGALLMSEDLPAHLAPAAPKLRMLQNDAVRRGVTVAALALAYPEKHRAVSRILIGVQNASELAGNLESFSSANALPAFQTETYAVDDPSIIDPRRWNG
jgi:aryl-alcohol dehydrogenase-like predicted oxidoreductase